MSKDVPKSGIGRAELTLKIEELSGLPLHHPFEFHLVDEEEAARYLRRIGRAVRPDDA